MAAGAEKQDEVRHESVEVANTSPVNEKASSDDVPTPTPEEEDEEVKVKMSWRTWVVLAVCTFAVTSQVFVVGGATSVIAFIVRDIGDLSDSPWIIQGPLLMQSVLSPTVGRLSDVLDRKWMVTIPPIIAATGAVVCATAKDMSVLIGGGILIGFTLATIAIVQSIPSEILPMKYRPIANGLAGFGGAVGGLIGKLASGAVTNINPKGWRYIFWIQFALHMTTALGFLLFYWPRPSPNRSRMTYRQMFWAIDPIGSALFIVSTTLMLMSLNWGGSRFAWKSPEVAAPLSIGCVVLVLFCLYQWKGRDDGIIAHVFFRNGPNFVLSIFAFAVEGWIYYSAVNAFTPQLVLNLGFENNSWSIAIRQMAFSLMVTSSAIPISIYATKFKDLKTPILATFVLFFIVTVLYANVRPTWSKAQIGFNIMAGLGQAGPLTLIPACVQFTAPHEYLSTATGVAFTARAVGGAFGSAVLSAIINGHLASHYNKEVGGAAIKAGLPEASATKLIAAVRAGNKTAMALVPGANPAIIASAVDASHWTYAHAYRLAWSSIIPFTIMAIVAISFLRGIKELMTNRIEATVEKVPLAGDGKVVQAE